MNHDTMVANKLHKIEQNENTISTQKRNQKETVYSYHIDVWLRNKLRLITKTLINGEKNEDREIEYSDGFTLCMQEQRWWENGWDDFISSIFGPR